MRQVIYDLETNGLLKATEDKPRYTRVWCLALCDAEDPSAEVEVYHDFPEACCRRDGSLREGYSIVSAAQRRIGYNSLAYDDQVLEREGNPPVGEALDLLVENRLHWPDIKSIDKKRKAVPSRLKGSHSLEAWGYRLHKHKGDFNDYSKFSPEMVDYCIGDVETTRAVYKNIQRQGWTDLARS